MFTIRRKAVQSVERIPTAVGRSTRRYASGHGGQHGHTAPQSEPLGTQVWVFVAAFPLAGIIYKISRPGEDGQPTGFTNIINSYSQYKELWEARNTLHTAAIEQAGFDRNLYISSKGSKHVNLRFPEIFNTGCPDNVSAGQGPRNMDQLVAHYEKLNADEEARKLKALKARQS